MHPWLAVEVCGAVHVALVHGYKNSRLKGSHVSRFQKATEQDNVCDTVGGHVRRSPAPTA